MKTLFLFFSFVSPPFLIFSQTTSGIDTLLNKIFIEVTDSKEIINNQYSKKIIASGQNVLPLLQHYYRDSSLTQIYSFCKKRILNKGEVAYILTDQIEMIPYCWITGSQNCLMETCPSNPNGVEYYFNWNFRYTINDFSDAYLGWYNSKEHKKWAKIFSNRN